LRFQSTAGEVPVGVSLFGHTNYFWMLYALYNKVHNFGTCKHHGSRFINCLFMKLIILCYPLLNVSHIQKRYQNDIIWHFKWFFWWICAVKTKFTFPTKKSITFLKTSSIMIKLFCLILCKCRKLRLNLVKSKSNSS
jgi:hypothetical protein